MQTQLGLTHMVTSLTSLLEETDVRLFLAGVVILGKVCMTCAMVLLLAKNDAGGGVEIRTRTYSDSCVRVRQDAARTAFRSGGAPLQLSEICARNKFVVLTH